MHMAWDLAAARGGNASCSGRGCSSAWPVARHGSARGWLASSPALGRRAERRRGAWSVRARQKTTLKQQLGWRAPGEGSRPDLGVEQDDLQFEEEEGDDDDDDDDGNYPAFHEAGDGMVLTDDMLASDPRGHRAGFTAIVGRPNAGKSTLLNALLGQKLSSVTAKAQTTRHRILCIDSQPQYQMVILDTPGIVKDERNQLDARMMRSVRQATEDADAVLLLVDAAAQPRKTLEELQRVNAGHLGKASTALVLNKVDLVPKSEVDQLVTQMKGVPSLQAVFAVSALKGRGIEDVKAWAVAQLPEGPSMYPKDIVSEYPERFFVSEIVQEKIFKYYYDEIPYCTTVQVIDYKERPGGKDFIDAHVIVETPGQRGIILGKGGSALKTLGAAARADIEEFLGREVYLELSVKVQEKWRKNEKTVMQYGY